MKHKKQQTEDYFAQRYRMLNKEQRKAVDTIEGPVMVIAGPGTGKTEILTMRIANILRQAGTGVGPENILALTFTNAGVSAMRARLADLVGAQTAYNVGIYTFHSFCEEQMNRYPEFFPRFAHAHTIGDVERLRLVENIVSDGDYKILKTFSSTQHYVKGILSAIEELKREGVTPDEFRQKIAEQKKDLLADEKSYYKRKYKNYRKGDLKPTALTPVERNLELADVYTAYQDALLKNDLYDFSDMIIAVADAMESSDAFHATLLEQYQYILVDEHQDTNEGQNKILGLLSMVPTGDDPNLFTVGDDKQAIYRFQGASVENFMHFAQQFPTMVTINLTQNYRSSQEILDTAHTLISAEEGDRKHTALHAGGVDDHRTLAVHAFGTYIQELAFVARDVKKQITQGTAPEDIAIIYLQNKHLADIKAALEREGISYTISSRENLLHDHEMRKLFLLLHAVADPMNAESLGRALLIDFLGCDIRDLLLLFDATRYGKKARSLFPLLTTLQTDTIEGIKDIETLQRVATFFTTQKSAGENEPFLAFFEQFIRESGFLAHILGKDSHRMHLRQLETLMGEIRTQIQSKPDYRLSDFLTYIDTLMAYDLTINVPRDHVDRGVQLMTAHGSKGLEFESVYITNAVHKLWDHKRTRQIFRLPLPTQKSDLNDERRLFYVALTRAKRAVTITYALRDLDGREKTPTLFIEELAGKDVHMYDHTTDESQSQDLFRERTKNLVHILDQRYIHDTFLATPLSVSALNNYMKSPLVYFFRNLIRLPQAQTKSLLFGNVIHSALERYFNVVKEQGSVAPLSVLLESFDTALRQAFLLAEYYDDVQSRGSELLTQYYQQYKDSFHVHILTEKKIRAIPFLLDDGNEILLTGIIDKIEILDNGTVRVVDYKTGKAWSEKTKEEKEALRRQIIFYKMLLDGYVENDGTTYNMVEGVLDFVEKNKKDQFEKKTFQVSKEDVAVLEREIRDFASDILQGTFLECDFAPNRDNVPYLDLLHILQIAHHKQV